jgi:hypothetical protein
MRLGDTAVLRPASCAALVAATIASASAIAVTGAFASSARAAPHAHPTRPHASAGRRVRTRSRRHRQPRQPPTCPGAKLPQVTVSPLPGTPDAPPQTQVSFLGAQASQLRSVSVIGSRTGRHAGVLRSYLAAAGASLLPSTPFAEGERVTVCATVITAAGPRRVATSFQVASPAKLAYQAPFEAPGTRGNAQAYHSTDVKPPKVSILHAAEASSAPGYILATPYAGPAEHGAMIFESSGRLIWFHRPPNPSWGIANLSLQDWEGHEDLVWWQGQINTYGFGAGEDVIADDAYEPVARVRGGNGLQADLHDVALTPSGAALLTVYYPVHARARLRRVVVLDCAVQEIDVSTGLVMWEWHSLGHVPLRESRSRAPRSGPYDYFHLASLQQLSDGDLLISARNASAVYDIRPHSGRIAWQLGGRRSSFELGSGVRVASPEEARMLPGGQLAIYDGAAGGPSPRGEIVQLEPSSRTASLAPGGELLSGGGGAPRNVGEGSLQPLPGGGWLAGWGGLPGFTEFGPEGGVAYEARFPPSEVGYRVYRAPWQGRPLAPPNVVASVGATSTTVYASWNGATGVTAWRLLAGASPATLEPVAVTPASGFETAIATQPAAYVQMQALGPGGEVLSESKTIAAGRA